ncbi:hypothetical protein HAX54_036619 [Datura stramonium]|uniref:Uncharacterized protein n=1 Tax=Datura stramonium TaxID=4076 RepID=A0ABS8VH44_DATST|nr:hypothetical protein [Datura stramonium]
MSQADGVEVHQIKKFPIRFLSSGRVVGDPKAWHVVKDNRAWDKTEMNNIQTSPLVQTANQFDVLSSNVDPIRDMEKGEPDLMEEKGDPGSTESQLNNLEGNKEETSSIEEWINRTTKERSSCHCGDRVEKEEGEIEMANEIIEVADIVEDKERDDNAKYESARKGITNANKAVATKEGKNDHRVTSSNDFQGTNTERNVEIVLGNLKEGNQEKKDTGINKEESQQSPKVTNKLDKKEDRKTVGTEKTQSSRL